MMSNKWDEMREAYKEAIHQVQAADTIVERFDIIIKEHYNRILSNEERNADT